MMSLFLSKGKTLSYIIGLVSCVLYIVVSFQNKYYGEIIITLTMSIPIMIFGMISWIRNQDSTKTVIVNKIKAKELTFLIVSQVVMFWGYYFMLKAFDTESLIISSLSICVSFFASYLEARRSDLCFFMYAINDIILICLWIMPIVYGDMSALAILVSPCLMLISDIYGIFNWKKIKKTQISFQKNTNDTQQKTQV